MHIAEGVLSAPVLIAGAAAAAVGVAYGLRKIQTDHLMQRGGFSCYFRCAASAGSSFPIRRFYGSGREHCDNGPWGGSRRPNLSLDQR